MRGRLFVLSDEPAPLFDRGPPPHLGYAIAWYARWYVLNGVLGLGRVSSGSGGELASETAGRILKDEFPELAERIRILTPDMVADTVGLLRQAEDDIRSRIERLR